MTCLPCFTSFLDIAPPELRENLHASLAQMEQLPLEQYQAELDQYQNFFAEVDTKLSNVLEATTITEGLTASINQAIIDQGIMPGDCPQLDAAIEQIDLYESTLKANFAAPLTKSLNTIQGQIAGVSGLIANANILISTAGGFVC